MHFDKCYANAIFKIEEDQKADLLSSFCKDNEWTTIDDYRDGIMKSVKIKYNIPTNDYIILGILEAGHSYKFCNVSIQLVVLAYLLDSQLLQIDYFPIFFINDDANVTDCCDNPFVLSEWLNHWCLSKKESDYYAPLMVSWYKKELDRLTSNADQNIKKFLIN